MTTALEDTTTPTSSVYAALRYGGAPAALAQIQLGLKAAIAAQLERLFLRRQGGGSDPMRPAFADDERHVAAVLAEGGFMVLPERGR